MGEHRERVDKRMSKEMNRRFSFRWLWIWARDTS